MVLVAVVTKLGKRRMAEAVGGIVSGTLAPGLVNRSIVPVFYQLGETLLPLVPPDPLKVALVDAAPFQKNFVAGDFAVIIPSGLVVAGALPFDPSTDAVAEPTLRVRVFADVNEAVFSPAKLLDEVGVFVQFGVGLNPPELFAYGTFPAFAKSAGLTVDFTLDVKF